MHPRLSSPQGLDQRRDWRWDGDAATFMREDAPVSQIRAYPLADPLRVLSLELPPPAAARPWRHAEPWR